MSEYADNGASVVLDAAVAWWLERRPIHWVAQQHFSNPAVNTRNDAEKRLAEAVAVYAEPVRTPEGELL